MKNLCDTYVGDGTGRLLEDHNRINVGTIYANFQAGLNPENTLRRDKLNLQNEGVLKYVL